MAMRSLSPYPLRARWREELFPPPVLKIGEARLDQAQADFLRSCVSFALKRNPIERENPIAVQVEAMLAR